MLYAEDQYTEVFHHVDKDSDGLITLDDFTAAVRGIDSTFPSDIIKKAFEAAKQNPPKDRMDCEEFMEAMRRLNGYLTKGVPGNTDPILYGHAVSKMRLMVNSPRFQEAMYEAVFHEADTDSDGLITYEDFCTITRKYDMDYLAITVKREFGNANTRGDGRMTLREFMIAMGFRWREEVVPEPTPAPKTTVKKGGIRDSLMRSIFNSMDDSGNGALNREEVKNAFEQLGQPMSDAEVLDMFKAANKDDKVDELTFEEFVNAVHPS